MPSCGTTSSRFGCWTCTIVEKDKSLAGFVEAGFGQFAPLLDFRDWLIAIRNDPERRLARRRDGRFTIGRNGAYVPGPINIATRKEMLDRLLSLQDETGMPLIHDDEVCRIRELWVEDVLASAARNLREQRLAVAEG